MQVFLLGRFDVLLNGQSIVERLKMSKKSSAVLKYLLLNYGNALTAQQIIDIFWADESVSNPESALKTMISRIRERLSRADPALASCIIAERGSYRWNTRVVCEVDAVLFENLCARSLGAQDEEALDIYARVLELYAGDIVPLAATDDWLIERSVFLHNLFLRAMHRYLRLLEERGEHDTAVHVARMAQEIDFLDEGLHLSYMRALKALGSEAEAVAHYRHMTGLFYKYLGSEPTEKLVRYYEDLTRATLSQQADLSDIRDSLLPQQDVAGAFLCDYSVFQKIYEIQMRIFERMQVAQAHLALFTLEYRENTQDAGRMHIVLEQAMDDLADVLIRGLRKGDTIARYSINQYAVLLPLSSDGFGGSLSARIKKAFYARQSARLSFQMLPIGAHSVPLRQDYPATEIKKAR